MSHPAKFFSRHSRTGRIIFLPGQHCQKNGLRNGARRSNAFYFAYTLTVAEEEERWPTGKKKRNPPAHKGTLTGSSSGLVW